MRCSPLRLRCSPSCAACYCAAGDCRRTGQPGLPGRRWFRQPYLGAHGVVMRSAASPPPTGPCPEGRAHGPPPAGVLLPAKAPLMRAPPAGPGLPAGLHPGGTRYMTGTRELPTHRRAANDLHRQADAAASLSGASTVPAAAGRPARTASARASASRRRGPGRGQSLPGHTICPPGSWTGRPARAAFAGPRGSVPRRRVKPCPPPYQPPLPRGRGHCLAEPDLVLAWLASTLPEPATGRICVLTGNRAQPVAGHVVCFPIACYGLTPRCREVKR